MTAVRLHAHFDGKVILPDEPASLPLNKPLILTVLVLGDGDTAMGRDDTWDDLAVAAFAEAAYGENEPDYGPEDLIRE